MSHNDDLSLDLLDEVVARLHIIQHQLIDAEAQAHATQAELTRLAHASRDEDGAHGPDRTLELRRAMSLATGAATLLRSLLDDVGAWLIELAGHGGSPES